MTSEFEAELLHYIGTAKGATTKEPFLDVEALRRNGKWPYSEPEDLPALQLVLFSLQARGHIWHGSDGWWPASHVQRGKPGARALPAGLFE